MPDDVVPNCVDENRLGSFELSTNWLLALPNHLLAELFKHFVIVTAVFHPDKVEYLAFSPLFGPSSLNAALRRYNVNVTVVGHREADKVDGRLFVKVE